MLGLEEGESGRGFRVGKEEEGGLRRDSFRMGDEGKEGVEETRVLVQFFCFGLVIEQFSLLAAPSAASN